MDSPSLIALEKKDHFTYNSTSDDPQILLGKQKKGFYLLRLRSSIKNMEILLALMQIYIGTLIRISVLKNQSIFLYPIIIISGFQFGFEEDSFIDLIQLVRQMF